MSDMNNLLQLDLLNERLVEPLYKQWDVLIAFLPKAFAALLVILIGIIIGWIIARLTASLLRKAGIDKLSRSAGVDEVMAEGGLKSTPSRLIGKMMFWLVVFTAFIPATDLLGIEELVKLTEKFVLYLPKIIAAVIIIVFGFVVANFLKQTIKGGKGRMGLTTTSPVANMVYGLTIAVTVVVALRQLELDTRLLHNVLITVIAAMSLAVAVAIGLGARDLAHNLVAGFYARESFQPGQELTFEGHTGVLKEIRAQNTIIDVTEDGSEHTEEISIPNHLLFKHLVRSKF